MPVWLDALKRMKKESGLSTKEIAAAAKMPEPTLEKLFAGATKDPRLSTITQLVHFLGYTLDDLTFSASPGLKDFSDHELEMIAKYRSLDERGRQTVDDVLDSQYRAASIEEADLFSGRKQA